MKVGILYIVGICVCFPIKLFKICSNHYAIQYESFMIKQNIFSPNYFIFGNVK